jgi:hypothetical protein
MTIKLNTLTTSIILLLLVEISIGTLQNYKNVLHSSTSTIWSKKALGFKLIGN